MKGSTIAYKPIGVIHSEHTVQDQTPIQPVYAVGCRGCVEVFPKFVEGLRDLDGTPLLDIKPYTAKFDRIDTKHNGWQDEVHLETAQRRGQGRYTR